jgi:3-dehydroquinate synthase
MTSRNIILTGFMGTGKTTVGRLLAARTGRIFVDTDELIVQRAGKSIAAIFETEGAATFRQMEGEIARELSESEGAVIATGGRLMLDPENAALLEPDSLVLSLSARPEEILARLAADAVRRPLLEVDEPEKQVAKLLREREEGYGRYPQISTGERSPDAVATEIIERFELQAEVAAASQKTEPARHLMVTHPDGHYDVVVGKGVLRRLTDHVPMGNGPFVVVSDSHVAPLYASLIQGAADIITIPAGEQHKTLETVRYLYDRFLEANLDRKSTVVALGGGVVGDITGFAAATYMRGVRFVQCPTSLLAMVDASVGGKTGVDLPQGKNLVGAFKQPAAVMVDLATLRTLPPSQFAAGMAEAVKHGLIAGEGLFRRMEGLDWKVPNVFQSPMSNLQTLVVDAIRVKRDVVQSDPFEMGRRAILNLGHTFAHAIEQVSGYAVGHGEAVAMGLVAAANLSIALGHCPASLQPRLENVLQGIYLPTRIPTGLDPEAMLEAMQRDKKKAAGKLRFVLLSGVGSVFVSGDVPREAVLETLRQTQE